ncbi:major facilitator superfamily domain-containing protein [Halteromyces radiatus]|uniref:major facilitator superfamily domain-containing protein n=1 Tax=Halteromyces radiatus TaxID=101107 RepID=UPI00221FAF1A|nr:major facilitator superfamily domain-containing protein [Halteromyces radiatus]KAI8097591.1 major facilitator superfamily domain-containing protein [Halteromyces radiatus]
MNPKMENERMTSDVNHDGPFSMIEKKNSEKVISNRESPSEKRTSIIIFVIAMASFIGPLESMIYMPGLLSIANYFHASHSAVNASISSFMIFMGISPLIWATLSEKYGRRKMFLLSSMINIVASFLCICSSNIWMLVVFRGLQSGGANAAHTLGAGVISDIIPIEQRGRAYALFSLGGLLGPIVGPSIGGILSEVYGWQSIFYFLTLLGIVQLYFKKNNTSHHTQTNQLSSHTILLLLQSPTVWIISLFNTTIYSSLYFLNPTITHTFQTLYGFNEWQVGLCYLPFGIGLMIGSIFSGWYSDRILGKLETDVTSSSSSTTTDDIKNDNILSSSVESRLLATIPSFLCIPAGFLVYGLTVECNTIFYAPLIGLFIFAFGQMSAFTPTTVYLVDSNPGLSATAVGISHSIRCLTASITTFYSNQVLDVLGPGTLFTGLAFLNMMNCLLVLICIKYGESWRHSFDIKHKSTFVNDQLIKHLTESSSSIRY